VHNYCQEKRKAGAKESLKGFYFEKMGYHWMPENCLLDDLKQAAW